MVLYYICYKFRVFLVLYTFLYIYTATISVYVQLFRIYNMYLYLIFILIYESTYGYKMKLKVFVCLTYTYIYIWQDTYIKLIYKHYVYAHVLGFTFNWSFIYSIYIRNKLIIRLNVLYTYTYTVCEAHVLDWYHFRKLNWFSTFYIYRTNKSSIA